MGYEAETVNDDGIGTGFYTMAGPQKVVFRTAKWYARWDSNPHLPAFEAGTSTNWVTSALVRMTGIEPALTSPSDLCLCQLGYMRVLKNWYSTSDSN